MKPLFSSAILLILLTIVTSGCHSLATPFIHLAPDYTALPKEEVQQLATAIEAAVWAGDRDFAPQNTAGVIVDTPEIRQAIRTRAARSELLREFLASGFAYEQQNGLIHIQRNKAYKQATSSRQRDRNALLVMSENNNRWTIYEGILKSSRFFRKRPLRDSGDLL